jgi:alpha-tubulin suppressor-like RCC1 family protein
MCYGSNKMARLLRFALFGSLVGCGAVPSQSETADASTPMFAHKRAVDLAVGSSHACVVVDDGTVWCWGGWIDVGPGNLPRTIHNLPIQVPGITRAVHVFAGLGRSCAVLDDSSVTCWFPLDGTPAVVPSLSGAMNIAMGRLHRVDCALLQRGTVQCWGEDDHLGLLGNGTTKTRTDAPVDVIGPSGVHWVQMGPVSACADAVSGLWCWGDSYGPLPQNSGQLDATVKSSSDANCYLSVGGEVRCSASAGGYGVVLAGASALSQEPGKHTCAIVAGHVSCWGANQVGQLGDGTLSARVVPTESIGIVDAVAVGVESNPYGDNCLYANIPCRESTCALLKSGAVRCWGANALGQLGDLTTTDTNVPIPVKGFE